MAVDLITRILNKASREESLVEMYSDPSNPNHFTVCLIQGRVVAGVVVFITFTYTGAPQGVAIAKVSSVFKVKIHTRYLGRLSDLIKTKRSQTSDNRIPRKVGKRGVGKFLREARRSAQRITVQTGNIKPEPYLLKGVVVGYDRSCFQMKAVDEYDDDAGIVVCRKKYVDSIEHGLRPRII